MCNINILIKKNKIKEITPFLMCVSANSFATNSHGEGIFIPSSNRLIKSPGKINYYNYKDEIENSNLIITHQRWSTSGFEVKYNHPFVSENFVMVHNGIINQFLNGSGSDSSGFFVKLNEEFKKITSHLSREDKILRVLKTLFNKDIGSYSIFIYDRINKNSYYFKNSYTHIYFWYNDNGLFITTSNSNDLFLDMIDKEKFKELEIQDRIIYRINPQGWVEKVKELPERKDAEVKTWEFEVQDKNLNEEEIKGDLWEI